MQYSIIQISVGQTPQPLVDALTKGWSILQSDSTSDMIIYILHQN